MKSKLTKFAQVAALGFALAFTFNCSSDDNKEGGGGSSSSSGDDNSLVEVREPVKIGIQTWMSSNSDLNATFRRCYGDEATNCKTFGGLYNWEAAKTACPSGWHLPSKDEWQELIDYVLVPAKLRSSNFGGTDNWGFSALPGGYGNSAGEYSDISKYGYWWSSSEYNSDSAYYRRMDNNNEFDEHYGEKSNLYSVRCVKD
ncbi:MAG: hypothetical protein LBC75_08365 [Fibromonadaceae bacterium]|jgi:uncharacterized protein (TIGR02145 family)|nr:hypothetical protein [Fibromonadaceae bacterium]